TRPYRLPHRRRALRAERRGTPVRRTSGAAAPQLYLLSAPPEPRPGTPAVPGSTRRELWLFLQSEQDHARRGRRLRPHLARQPEQPPALEVPYLRRPRNSGALRPLVRRG